MMLPCFDHNHKRYLKFIVYICHTFACLLYTKFTDLIVVDKRCSTIMRITCTYMYSCQFGLSGIRKRKFEALPSSTESPSKFRLLDFESPGINAAANLQAQAQIFETVEDKLSSETEPTSTRTDSGPWLNHNSQQLSGNIRPAEREADSSAGNCDVYSTITSLNSM
jgi:hypothetical protein